MRIATIVSSNSHVDYVGRIIDELDAVDPPSPDSYGFAQFVGIPSGDGEAVGIIYDSRLINPEYSNFGPRLSPKPSLENFSPDFLNEQGILIGILMLGMLNPDGLASHGVLRGIIPAGTDVMVLEPEKVEQFHAGEDGINLHYYSQVTTHAGPLAAPLLEAVIEVLKNGRDDNDRDRLELLAQNLRWQRTMAASRF